MACQDCANNCDGSQVSDKCVVYTGPDIPFLGVETGDSLSLLEAALIEKLESALDGTGIDLSSVTTCSAITDELGSNDKTLVNLVQAIVSAICELRTDLNSLTGQVNVPATFNLSCLTGLPASPTRDNILQAVINKVCEIEDSVVEVEEDYVKQSELCAKVAQCLSSSLVQENTKMPKYVAVPYHGPLSVFDSQGKGLASAGYDKIYICNGQTVGTFVTPDYRGRSPIGVNSGIPGGAMDSAVDPGVSANAGYLFVNKTKNGNYTHTLNTNESASHTHSVTDPGHDHDILGISGGDNNDNNNTSRFSGGDKNNNETTFHFTNTTAIVSNTTGITISSSGGGQPHNNLHPVIGGVFIIYVP